LAQTAASSPQRGSSGVDRQSTHFQAFQSAVYSGSSTANTGFSLSIDDKLYANTLPTQLKTLLARTALVMRKRRKQQVAVIVRNLIIGLFFGSIYYQLDTGTDSTVYTNRFALFFFTLIFMMLSMQEALPAVFEARLLYYRERGSRAYHVLPYWVSTWLYKLPVLAMGNLTYCLCVYNLSGLNDDSGRFSSMYWTVLLFTFTSLFTTQTVAHLNGSQAAAIQYLPVYLFFNVMFAGFIIYIPSVQDWLSWGPEIMPMRYAFQSLVRNELDGNNDLPNRDDYLGEMGFDELTSAECISIQLMWLLVAVAVSLVVLSKVDHEQR
jgi:ABC-type multidrug transport system permease subunit